MHKILSCVLSTVFTLSTGLLSATLSHAFANGQRSDSSAASVKGDSSEVIFFNFSPQDSMFFFAANEEEIREASRLIEFNRAKIQGGTLLISVDGYCSSFETERLNYRMAKLCSSQIKSYFITNYGMKEEYFVTANHAFAYEGHPEIAVKMLLVNSSPGGISQESHDAVQAAAEVESSVLEESEDTQDEKPARTVPSPEVKEEDSVHTEDAALPDGFASDEGSARSSIGGWSFKTNIPAWALVVANAAVEYRFSEHWSVDFPVYYSCWTTARTYRFRTLAIQPSLRYWLSPEWKGHFFGVHLTTGQYNVSIDNNTRYQDVNGMYGIGLDYGYGLNLSEHWGLEFNIGAGYIYTKYNSFYNIDNGALFNTSVKNYWGLTRCGISIIYRL